MATTKTRRDFLRDLLAASLCSYPYASAVGQLLPQDNAFQARLSHLYVEQEGRLRQILLVDVPPSRGSGSVEVTIGKKTERIDLRKVRKIHGQYYLPIEPVEQEETARLVLHQPRKPLETFLQVRPTRRWQVYIVHNSHQDPGFLELPSALRARFVPYIDEAMKYCSETSTWPPDAQFRWNIEVGYLVEDYAKARSPEKLQEVMNWVKKNRMTIGGTYCDAETDLMSLETLHRFVYYSTNRLTNRFGIDLEGAIIDDVNGFTWALPEVMAKSGVRYLVFGANGDRDNMQNGNAPTLFYLEGPDGSEILVWRSVVYIEGYDLVSFADPYNPKQIIKGVDIHGGERVIAPYFERHEKAGYPFDSILLQAAWDFAPPMKEFSEVVRTWNSQWAFPHLRLSTLPEFFHGIEAHHRAEIPRLRGGAPDAWVDLHNGEALSAALARQTENYLPDIEKFSTLAHIFGSAPSHNDELTDAYNHLALFEGHTIELYHDADIYTGEGKANWDEKVAHINLAHDTAKRIGQQSLHSLSANIRTSKSTSLVVWNPLSWQRSEIVRTAVPNAAASPFRLLDSATGMEVPYQLDERDKQSPVMVFFAENVPPLGYRCYSVDAGQPASQSKLAVSGMGMENSYYSIALSEKDGTVASLFDKELKREFVDPKADQGLNALVYRVNQRITEREYKTLADLPMEGVTVTQGASGPVFGSLKVSGHIGDICTFEHEIILYPGTKRIDFFNRIRKRPVYTKESVYYAFPFRVPSDISERIRSLDHFNTYRIDMPGSIMQPDVDQIPGSDRDNYVSQHWMSISRKDYGVLWSSADAPLVELGGIQTDKFLPYLTMQDDNWLNQARLYSFLMHNHWVVDVPIAQGGDYLFRYAVTTHGPEWTYNTAHHFGWGFMSPLQVFVTERAQAGHWSEPARSFLEISPANVYLAGFKVAEDGDGAILRLYEGCGLSSTATLHFDLPGHTVKSAVACDGREKNLSALSSNSASFEVPLKPFETRTVRVRWNV